MRTNRKEGLNISKKRESKQKGKRINGKIGSSLLAERQKIENEKGKKKNVQIKKFSKIKERDKYQKGKG